MQENNKVASIIVTDFEDNNIDLLEKYKDETLLIIIYNNKCLGCTGRAIPLAYDFQKEYKDLRVLGIHSNFGNEKTTKAAIESIFTIDDLPFPIYLDEDHKVFEQFESQGTPQWVIIDKKGILYRSLFGSQEGSQNRLMYALEDLLLK